MKSRILVAVIGVPVLFAALLLCPPWATLIITCGMTAIAAYEMIHTAAGDTPAAAYVITISAAVLALIARFLNLTLAGGIDALHLIRFVMIVCLFALAVFTYGKGHPLRFRNLAVCALSGVMIPAFYGCLFLLRQNELYGKCYVLAPFFVAFLGDTLSMFAGMLFGKRKLAPHVSPKKTVAGGIGGLAGGAVGMVLLGLIAGHFWQYPANYPLLAAVGAGANIFGQLGDLSMSVIKREVDIKDYSHLFLDHGGMLDRFDSTLLIAPVIWLCVCGGIL
ncbi:MAG: phosphatidate cytidylyltransferase [Oscillospiraceae bacterium]|nr:phosphatidate cytidylyltransferase [Oscillospiraceae bacterium]